MQTACKRNEFFKKLLLSSAVYAFVCLTVCFFFPMELFLGNRNDFSFPFANLWWLLPAFSLTVAAAAALITALLPGRAAIIINVIIYSFGLCYYIQALAMNGSMSTMTGACDSYSAALLFTNTAIWLAIITVTVAAALVLMRLSKRALLQKGLAFTSIALIVMQLTGVISLAATVRASDAQRNTYLSVRGETELSAGNNVIYFIIDTCDNVYVEQALKKYPDLFSNLGGFTYFPNTSVTHSRTYPAIPFLLTEQKCCFDKPYTDYINDAYSKSRFIPDMNGLDTDIRIFTDEKYIGDPVKDKVDNCIEYAADISGIINNRDLILQSALVSAYRGMPYVFKSRFRYTAKDVDSVILSKIADYSRSGDEINFYNRLCENGIQKTDAYDKAFRFYHFGGTHIGAVITADAGKGSDYSAPEDALRGNIRIIEKYVADMRQLGIYDSSTIIITADHGLSFRSNDLSLAHPPACIMLVKPAGASAGTPLKTSAAPVCQEDLFATVISALGGNSGEYGRTIFEINENEQRNRYYYHTALYSDDDGEVALREYLINGDARKLSSYTLTGKYWDINYSERAVSRHRLSAGKKN